VSPTPAPQSSEATSRSCARLPGTNSWYQLQAAAGKDDNELYGAGDLLAIALAVRSKDDESLRRTWQRMDGRLRSIGFWLGQWSQWQHALRR
jgi:hypothetical protein